MRMNEKEFRSANNVIDLEDCPSITCVFDKQSQTWHTVPNRKINWGKRVDYRKRWYIWAVKINIAKI